MSQRWRFIVVCAVLAAAGLFIWTHENAPVPMKKPFSDFPFAKGEWKMASQANFSSEVLSVLRPTDYLSRRYESADGRRVELYIGYHSGARESGPIHSPKQCLPGGGWFKLSEGKSMVNAGEREIEVISAAYQKGDQKELFVYWYEVKGKVISNEYALKASEVMNSVLHGRRDSAFIRISVPLDDTGEAQAKKAAERFIKEFYSSITGYLPD